MTWRDIWNSTVTHLRALLGFSPRPRPVAAPIVKHTPKSLAGPVIYPTYPERANRPQQTGLSIPHAKYSPQSPQTIDLVATRPMPSISAPLRRKPSIAHVDVAVDGPAFASKQGQRMEIVAASNGKQGISTPHAEKIGKEIGEEIEVGEGDPFDGEEPSGKNGYGPNGHEGNGYHDNGHDKNGYGGNGHGGGGHDGNGGSGGGFDADDGDDASDAQADEGVALTTLLESLLFVAAEPVEPRQLAQTLALPLETIELGLAELADYYQRSLRGLRIQRFQGKAQLVTAPAAAPFIELFLNLDTSTRLSSPALETLAVIAYRQPVTRAQIEAVRGVDCAGVLRSLVQRGLVVEVGRMEGIGRPILYGVTELFMQHFGLMEMGELPPLAESDADRLWTATVIEEQELGNNQKS